jgi:hypothetical protein
MEAHSRAQELTQSGDMPQTDPKQTLIIKKDRPMVRKIFICLILLLLYGCIAFGVPYTNDPIEKLQYACALI